MPLGSPQKQRLLTDLLEVSDAEAAAELQCSESQVKTVREGKKFKKKQAQSKINYARELEQDRKQQVETQKLQHQLDLAHLKFKEQQQTQREIEQKRKEEQGEAQSALREDRKLYQQAQQTQRQQLQQQKQAIALEKTKLADLQLKQDVIKFLSNKDSVLLENNKILLQGQVSVIDTVFSPVTTLQPSPHPPQTSPRTPQTPTTNHTPFKSHALSSSPAPANLSVYCLNEKCVSPRADLYTAGMLIPLSSLYYSTILLQYKSKEYNSEVRQLLARLRRCTPEFLAKVSGGIVPAQQLLAMTTDEFFAVEAKCTSVTEPPQTLPSTYSVEDFKAADEFNDNNFAAHPETAIPAYSSTPTPQPHQHLSNKTS